MAVAATLCLARNRRAPQTKCQFLFPRCTTGDGGPLSRAERVEATTCLSGQVTVLATARDPAIRKHIIVSDTMSSGDAVRRYRSNPPLHDPFGASSRLPRSTYATQRCRVPGSCSWRFIRDDGAVLRHRRSHAWSLSAPRTFIGWSSSGLHWKKPGCSPRHAFDGA